MLSSPPPQQLILETVCCLPAPPVTRYKFVGFRRLSVRAVGCFGLPSHFAQFFDKDPRVDDLPSACHPVWAPFPSTLHRLLMSAAFQLPAPAPPNYTRRRGRLSTSTRSWLVWLNGGEVRAKSCIYHLRHSLVYQQVRPPCSGPGTIRPLAAPAEAAH